MNKDGFRLQIGNNEEQEIWKLDSQYLVYQKYRKCISQISSQFQETNSIKKSDIKKGFSSIRNSNKLVTHDGTIKLHTLLGPLTCGVSFEYLQIPYKLKGLNQVSYGYNTQITEANNVKLKFLNITGFKLSRAGLNDNISSSSNKNNFITIQKDPAQTETCNL